MANLVPVAIQAISAFQAVSTVANVVGKGLNVFDNSGEKQSQLALEQLQQQQKIQQQQAAAKAVLDKQEIETKAAEAEKQRRDALKRAVARQRAQFGGSGVSAGDGSSEAVLLGMFNESDAERQTREKLDNLKLQAIDQNLLNQKRVNTLQRTQLAEKNKLKNSTSPLETVTDLFSIF
ncbi:MAG TPA: hypothetical protein PLF01_03430 [Alphaproteobacteria bacterium]|nr:hypothetical protein [Alphaproteobacteria bacterium]